MAAELQLPTPIVPIRSAYFARYRKKHADWIWAIADESIGSPHPMRFHRRPSGCLIEAMANGYSKVTWVEHVEVDDRFVHQLYKPLVNSSLTCGAQRWLGTLGCQCERIASVLASIPSSDLANMGISNQEGKRSMMRLAGRLVRSYNQGLSSTTPWLCYVLQLYFRSPFHQRLFSISFVMFALEGSGTSSAMVIAIMKLFTMELEGTQTTGLTTWTVDGLMNI